MTENSRFIWADLQYPTPKIMRKIDTSAIGMKRGPFVPISGFQLERGCKADGMQINGGAMNDVAIESSGHENLHDQGAIANPQATIAM